MILKANIVKAFELVLCIPKKAYILLARPMLLELKDVACQC